MISVDHVGYCYSTTGMYIYIYHVHMLLNCVCVRTYIYLRLMLSLCDPLHSWLSFSLSPSGKANSRVSWMFHSRILPLAHTYVHIYVCTYMCVCRYVLTYRWHCHWSLQQFSFLSVVQGAIRACAIQTTLYLLAITHTHTHTHTHTTHTHTWISTCMCSLWTV